MLFDVKYLYLFFRTIKHIVELFDFFVFEVYYILVVLYQFLFFVLEWLPLLLKLGYRLSIFLVLGVHILQLELTLTYFLLVLHFELNIGLLLPHQCITHSLGLSFKLLYPQFTKLIIIFKLSFDFIHLLKWITQTIKLNSHSILILVYFFSIIEFLLVLLQLLLKLTNMVQHTRVIMPHILELIISLCDFVAKFLDLFIGLSVVLF